MRYVIVDLDGASRDYFDTLDAVGSALREAESDAPGAAAELYVVAYSDGGDRMAETVRGDEWLAKGRITTGAISSTQLIALAKARKQSLVAGARTEPPKVPA
jgi:hypothetical protein